MDYHLLYEWLHGTGLKSTDAISATHTLCPFGWVARLLCASASLCKLRVTTAPASQAAAGLSTQHLPQCKGHSQHSHIFRTVTRFGLSLEAYALVIAISVEETEARGDHLMSTARQQRSRHPKEAWPPAAERGRSLSTLPLPDAD